MVHRKHSRSSHKKRGGATSATTWMQETVGPLNPFSNNVGSGQWPNVFANGSMARGNEITHLSGQPASSVAANSYKAKGGYSWYNPSNCKPGMLCGGKKSRRSAKKTMKGGFWGQVSQALVPFGLLAAQHTYSKYKRHPKKATRKFRM